LLQFLFQRAVIIYQDKYWCYISALLGREILATKHVSAIQV